LPVVHEHEGAAAGLSSEQCSLERLVAMIGVVYAVSAAAAALVADAARRRASPRDAGG
jgi:hypothetical protein